MLNEFEGVEEYISFCETITNPKQKLIVDKFWVSFKTKPRVLPRIQIGKDIRFSWSRDDFFIEFNISEVGFVDWFYSNGSGKFDGTEGEYDLDLPVDKILKLIDGSVHWWDIVG